MKWYRKIWNDPVGSQVIAAGILTLSAFVLGLILPTVRSWALESLGDISRIQVIGWTAIGFLTGVAFSVFIARYGKPTAGRNDAASGEAPAVPASENSASSEFVPYQVADIRHGLAWHVKKPPSVWLDRLPYGVSTNDVIDGPFHSKPDCAERAATRYAAHGNSLIIDDRCPRCGDRLYRGGVLVMKDAKTAVIEELRRLARLGEDVDGPRVLQHVGYWKQIGSPER